MQIQIVLTDFLVESPEVYKALFPENCDFTPLALANKANISADPFQVESQNVGIIMNWFTQFLLYDRLWLLIRKVQECYLLPDTSKDELMSSLWDNLNLAEDFIDQLLEKNPYLAVLCLKLGIDYDAFHCVLYLLKTKHILINHLITAGLVNLNDMPLSECKNSWVNIQQLLNSSSFFNNTHFLLPNAIEIRELSGLSRDYIDQNLSVKSYCSQLGIQLYFSKVNDEANRLLGDTVLIDKINQFRREYRNKF